MTYFKTFQLLLAAAFLPILSGCVSQTANTPRAEIDAPSTPMTVPQARKSLTEALNQEVFYRHNNGIRNVKFDKGTVSFEWNRNTLSWSLAGEKELTMKVIPRWRFRYAATVEYNGGKTVEFSGLGSSGYPAVFKTERDAAMFVDAVLTLRSHQEMTVSEAQTAFEESMKNGFVKCKEFRFYYNKVTFTIAPGKPRGEMLFSAWNNLSLKEDSMTSVLINGEQSYMVWMGESQSYATMFIDAMNVLRQAMLRSPDHEDANFATFMTEAKIWIAATPKPEMSEAARTCKVLAEDAFERKDFIAALEAYCDALDKYPTWPKGQYNAAILAAEIKDFDLAAQHMRRYLVLAPDAKDAQAAKDKLLLWQAKAKE